MYSLVHSFEKTIVQTDSGWLETWYNHDLTLKKYVYREAYRPTKSKSDINFHRMGGPALIFYRPGGIVQAETYYVNSEEHREDGPSHIAYGKTGEITMTMYKLHNKLHRIDGPALSMWDRHDYYLLGTMVLKEDFDKPGFIDAFIIEHS